MKWSGWQKVGHDFFFFNRIAPQELFLRAIGLHYTPMCLIFFSINNHPTYKLVVAANRDEFYHRKTAPASFWSDKPHILAGRDLEAQGTWLGITTGGKISLLTNYRDPKHINPSAPSRGQLVSDFLENGLSAEEYMRAIAPISTRYNGFNLLAGTPDALWYLSNYASGAQKLTSGLYGLSNHLLETPWPKVQRGKEKMKAALAHDRIEPQTLFDLLYDEQRASDEQLPDTGIGLERERALSSMFIKTHNYGSRCSTVILIDRNNRVLFTERVYNLETFAFQDQTFEFVIDQ